MIDLIILIIFILSLGGMLFILAKKAPVLIQLPEVHEGVQKENIFSSWIKKVKISLPDKMVVLKFLSKIRVWVLKLEKLLDNLLHRTRKSIVQKKKNGNPPAATPPTNGLPPKTPE